MYLRFGLAAQINELSYQLGWDIVDAVKANVLHNIHDA